MALSSAQLHGLCPSRDGEGVGNRTGRRNVVEAAELVALSSALLHGLPRRAMAKISEILNAENSFLNGGCERRPEAWRGEQAVLVVHHDLTPPKCCQGPGKNDFVGM